MTSFTVDCCWIMEGISRFIYCNHDDVILWTHFPHYWTFMRGIHPQITTGGSPFPAFVRLRFVIMWLTLYVTRHSHYCVRLCHDDVIKWKILALLCPLWPVDSLHKRRWQGALFFSLICAWTNDWANIETQVIWNAIVPIMTLFSCFVWVTLSVLVVSSGLFNYNIQGYFTVIVRLPHASEITLKDFGHMQTTTKYMYNNVRIESIILWLHCIVNIYIYIFFSFAAVCYFPAAWSANRWFYEMRAPVTDYLFYILEYSNHLLREIPVQGTAQGADEIRLLRQTCEHA